MAYNTKNILRSGDASPIPIPQFYNPTEDAFNPLTGANLGSGRYGADGVMWGKTAGGVYIPVQVNANGEVLTQLSGRNAEITTLVNAYAVTGADAFVQVGGLSGIPISAALINKYRDFDIYIVNTHDAAFRTSVAPYGMIGVGAKVRMQDGTVAIYDTTTQTSGCQHTILAGEIEFLSNIWPANTEASPVKSVDPTPFKKYRGDLKLFLRSKTAPTTGSISVYLVGVIN